MKKLSLLIILAGIVVVGIGVWQIIDTKLQTDAALKEAKEMVAQPAVPADTETADTKAGEKPKFGETVGLLVIPKINSELAIVEGTDPNDLAKGVGHYKDSFFPGENGQIVLSGHRDTVFRRLGELEIGDTFEVQMPGGQTVYQIESTKIVDADDRSIITLQDEEEELIVTTCYPFSYVGDAPQRYIIFAKPVNKAP